MYLSRRWTSTSLLIVSLCAGWFVAGIQVPTPETANMLLIALAHARYSNDTSLIRNYVGFWLGTSLC